MAEVTLRLEVDPTTKKKNLIISYESDSDSLPMEHEEDHKRLVDGLIEGGALKAADLGEIIVERVEQSASGGDEAVSTGESQTEKRSLGEGS